MCGGGGHLYYFLHECTEATAISQMATAEVLTSQILHSHNKLHMTTFTQNTVQNILISTLSVLSNTAQREKCHLELFKCLKDIPNYTTIHI